MILNIKNTIIAFDLDDTIYNELDYLKSAYKEIAVSLDKENWLKLYAHMLSLYRSKKNVFDILSRSYKIEKEKLIEQYRVHKPIIKPFDYLIPLLIKIKKMNGKIAIITDGRELTQNNKIKSLGLNKYLDLIIISEVVGTEKPNENNFKILELKFPNHNYIYIADNYKKDFITPNARKWTTIGLVDNGLNIHNNCATYVSNKKFSPVFLINNFNEIKLTLN
ncbi:HAD family hydrolase [Thalassobellus suaedae]|uniref:HAD-IA family hydrolase n=1 Tax=Thalassobellus suaedae TaxID=3074124 RepID=A0ABY9Y1W3_9FLAO|nr:HAD-IA family hydrolase [Flavobacteriaceae bacterium HL-DH10]